LVYGSAFMSLFALKLFHLCRRADETSFFVTRL
jgi:hypothetical protein